VSKDVQKWADVAMFKAAPIDPEAGPQVQLLSCNNDPLGTIAATTLMYEGKSVQSLSAITDEQRRYYLGQIQRSVLAAPLEFVNFHFIISGVTRGFTHQMVRQRTATYTQESTRFAVKESVPVGLPPSLAGTLPWADWWEKCGGELFPILIHEVNASQRSIIDKYAEQNASREQLWRKLWDQHVQATSTAYNGLINSGMPAEDARGLLPTNLLTRINYNTSLRGLLEHSGLRLCTQAQFEWRLVWMKIIEAIREYGKTAFYFRPIPEEVINKRPLDHMFGDQQEQHAAWQFDELSKIFKPICYQKGSCQFLSDVDRACTIRDRVQDFAKIGVPSSEWDSSMHVTKRTDGGPDYWIEPIQDSEWMLDPTSARISQ
jgi:thymidylate synthase (FAD)